MILAGWVLFTIGVVIRILTISQLKLSAHWRIQRPRELVKTGIYQYVRHPMYLGGLFDYTGLAIILTGNLGIAVLFFIFMLNFILDRIDREENFLATIYGQEYVEYFKKTKMLIPFLL